MEIALCNKSEDFDKQNVGKDLQAANKMKTLDQLVFYSNIKSQHQTDELIASEKVAF